MTRKIAVLTSGGCAAGLNAAIAGIVRQGTESGFEVYGVLNGWQGLLTGDFLRLKPEDVKDIEHIAGTILGTSRVNLFKRETNFDNGITPEARRAARVFADNNFECLVAMGGDDTLGAASKLQKVDIPMIGGPKTMDFDLNNTDYTFGFISAVDCIQKYLREYIPPTRSHGRVSIVPVLGRKAGWVTLGAATLSDADVVLIPEDPVSMELVARRVKQTYEDKGYAIVAISEGIKPYRGNEFVEAGKVDEFNNPKLSGPEAARALTRELKRLIRPVEILEKDFVDDLQLNEDPAFQKLLDAQETYDIGNILLIGSGSRDLGLLLEKTFSGARITADTVRNFIKGEVSYNETRMYFVEKIAGRFTFQSGEPGYIARGFVSEADRYYGLRLGEEIVKMVEAGQYGMVPVVNVDNLDDNDGIRPVDIYSVVDRLKFVDLDRYYDRELLKAKPEFRPYLESLVKHTGMKWMS